MLFRSQMTLFTIFVLLLSRGIYAFDSKVLDHPTSNILKGSLDSRDYLLAQEKFVEDLTKKYQKGDSVELYGKLLSQKEMASLLHQRDLLDVALKNPTFSETLKKYQFDSDAYIRGSFDSDMGKLKVYQELFLLPSAKSDFLFRFLQGRGPKKSWQAMTELFQKYDRKPLPFLNPKLSIITLRKIFNDHPILLGYFHEFPGMIDAVIAYETNVLNKNEFKNQILVNLGHSGPSAGYWKYLESILLPKHLAHENEILQDIFEGTQYHPEKNGDGHPHYFSPTSFESFVATFFDRMSQATRGGYFKIDYEVNGDPVKSLKTLLLEDNNIGTRAQLKLLMELMDKSEKVSEEQKVFFVSISKAGILYLEKYQTLLKKHISYEENKEEIEIQITFKGKKNAFLKKGEKYLFNGKEIPREALRLKLHQAVLPVLSDIENSLGDPFHDFRWK